jgi:hypothetical protein
MGCWDVYCFVCGNSCHAESTDKKTKWLEKCTFLTIDNKIISRTRF